ncbi:hypothetical protein RchiOBHm_Chr6g0291471 [Rosa chinensis]|uniref:Uncharacterized protein n=1 Tax=Rosa chinensis TaxID=74649 RepID=A0A2P6PW42_ROSCH|nr:hypothetical protein RchiOBHm_Chr6g0291471 [Rosa chinensis]
MTQQNSHTIKSQQSLLTHRRYCPRVTTRLSRIPCSLAAWVRSNWAEPPPLEVCYLENRILEIPENLFFFVLYSFPTEALSLSLSLSLPLRLKD